MDQDLHLHKVRREVEGNMTYKWIYPVARDLHKSEASLYQKPFGQILNQLFSTRYALHFRTNLTRTLLLSCTIAKLYNDLVHYSTSSYCLMLYHHPLCSGVKAYARSLVRSTTLQIVLLQIVLFNLDLLRKLHVGVAAHSN